MIQKYFDIVTSVWYQSFQEQSLEKNKRNVYLVIIILMQTIDETCNGTKKRAQIDLFIVV